MTPLTKEFIDSCPRDNGYRMRGIQTTRLESFIDAAFAFAVTMLVISFDSIPSSYDEMIVAIKSIPAFIVAVVQLIWIWHTHNVWSKRFGLDTAYTVLISTVLLIVVLIYVYPMRVMAAGMFAWLSNGYLPSNFGGISLEQLRDMFVFLGVGFIVLCLLFVEMYRYANRLRKQLSLDDRELFENQSLIMQWFGAAIIGVTCVILGLTLPTHLVPYSGFSFSLLGFWFPFVTYWRYKKVPNSSKE